MWVLRKLCNLQTLNWFTYAERYDADLDEDPLPVDIWPVICSEAGLNSLTLENGLKPDHTPMAALVLDVLQLSGISHLTYMRLESFESQHC